MLRTIPGTQEVQGREFMYIESPESETFHDITNSISVVCPGLALPKSGGAIEERVRVYLSEGLSLMVVSYKGDIESWRVRFVGFCNAHSRRYGFIRGNSLELSDGSSCRMEALDVAFQ